MHLLLLSACDRATPPTTPPTTAPDRQPTANVATDADLRADAAAVRSPGDGGGHLVDVRVPDAVPVSSPVELGLTFVTGPLGIAIGGQVQLAVSGFWGWSPPQTRDPDAPGFTVVEAPEGVVLEATAAAGTLFATVRGRPLAPGEPIRFTYGAGGTARSDRFAERAPAVWVGVDADGDGVRALLPDPVVVTTVAGPCARLLVANPSAVTPGAAVTLHVAFVDAVGNAGCTVEGPVTVSLPPWLTGPRAAWLDPDDHGVLTLPLTATGEGIGVVGVEGAGLQGIGNPLVVHPDAVPVLWADLQIHTSLSDGTGAPEDVLAYARDVAGLDVAALTDHDHWGYRYLDGDPQGRARVRSAVEATRRPGFVPLTGYEWTSWIWGHRHVLFFGPDEPWPSSLSDATDTPGELHAALAGRDVVVIPHHVAGGPVALDWSVGLHPALEPVVEVSSVHGQSASPELPNPIYDAVPDAFAEVQLARGRSFGMVGSTDGHDGHPGLSHLSGGGNGLTALVGAEPTSASVAATLRARATYATNGPRILVRFAVDGTPMGGHHPAGDATVQVRVVGTDTIARVELVGRGGLVASRPGGGPVFHATFPVSPSPGDLLYLRVLQEDGGLAWTSPVFFDGRPAGP